MNDGQLFSAPSMSRVDKGVFPIGVREFGSQTNRNAPLFRPAMASLEIGQGRTGAIRVSQRRGSDDQPQLPEAFHQGLKDTGFVDGQNVTIEYRWADNQYDRLPGMAVDLVRRQVTVLTATTTPGALAAKAATGVIPIVFETGGDPIKLGHAPQRDQHSKPERGGPYYQTHVHYST